MSTQSGFSFKKTALLSTALAVFCFWANDASAQSDQDKVEVEYVKPLDRPISIEENGPSLESQSIKSPVIKSSVQSLTLPVKREATTGSMSEKDSKKSETVPSTLSFNIFLYVVDKFKAD
jgi:hypothetical protein